MDISQASKRADYSLTMIHIKIFIGSYEANSSPVKCALADMMRSRTTLVHRLSADSTIAATGLKNP